MANQSDNPSDNPIDFGQHTEKQAETASLSNTKLIRALAGHSATENLASAQAAVLKLISTKAELHKTLEQIARLTDENIPCIATSIYLFDPAKQQLNVAVKNDAAQPIGDGIPVLLPLNPCASAVLEKKPVIITDFSSDARWPESQRSALERGFHGCWIFPVLGENEAVLGVLIFDSHQPHSLAPADNAIIDIALDLTRLALEYKNAEESRSVHTGEGDPIQQRTAELECANRALEAFCHSVCHELKGPLRTIDGFAAAVIDDVAGQLPAESVEMITLVQDNVRQMSELVQNLLTFACSSHQPIEKAPVNMTQLVRALIAEHHNQIQSRGVTIDFGFLPDCVGDPGLLRLVWRNLVSNAFKYTARSPHPSIEFGSTQTSELKIYWIKDNGVGFDPEDAAKLFQPFQRLHSRREYDGTGVGLALVENIIKRHGGSVKAESRRDGGAAFFFTLPY